MHVSANGLFLLWYGGQTIDERDKVENVRL